jgi:hypothetical protein
VKPSSFFSQLPIPSGLDTVLSSPIGILMFKFAICAGICFEWMVGPSVSSLRSLGSASIRALMAALLAWIALEALQAVWRTVMMLDDRAPRRVDPRPTGIGK